MRLSILFILSGLLISASVLASGGSGGKPFVNPLAKLKNGPAHFLCREIVPGTKAGGLMLFRFDVALGGPTMDPDGITVFNVQIGSQSGVPGGQSTTQWWDVPKEVFKNSGGRILFVGTPAERLYFSANYDGAPLGSHFGPEWSYELNIEQDVQSLLVFAHYETTHIVDHGQACADDWKNCEPRQRVIDNDVFLCEAQE